MGFFSKVFGPGSTKTSAQVSTQKRMRPRRASGSMRYDPHLVDSLKDDHRGLHRIYRDLLEARDRDDFKTVRTLLGKFKIALQAHLMVENVRFYVYLKQKYATDHVTLAYITDLRKEMDGISMAAVKFIHTYTHVETFTSETKRAFNANLAAICDVMTQRIALEESRLYALYQPE